MKTKLSYLAITNASVKVLASLTATSSSSNKACTCCFRAPKTGWKPRKGVLDKSFKLVLGLLPKLSLVSFLLCFHLRFKYKGKEDFAIRNANFSTTKPQSAGLCFGGDCGPYKWLTFVSSKLLDCLQFVLIANTSGDWEKAQIIQYKYTGQKNVLVIAKAGGGNWMKHARIKKQERKVMYGAKKRATHSHIWYHRKMVSSLTPWWKTPTTSNPPNSLQSFTTALHAWRRAWRTSRLQGP